MQTIWRCLAVIAALAACGGSGDENPGEITPPPAPAYVSESLGFLSGDNFSIAWAVNSAGQVVGVSSTPLRQRAFYWDNVLRDLTPSGWSGQASAISSGSAVYVAGEIRPSPQAPSRAVRWQPAASTVPLILDSAGSRADGVNDAGTVVGSFVTPEGTRGAIWTPGQPRIEIPPPPGYTSTFAFDINNDGVVIGTAAGASDPLAERAWVRLSDGRLFALPPAAGDVGSQASSVTDATSGQVTVVGTTISPVAGRRGIRWTCQVSTGAITTEVLLALTGARGITNSGEIAGITGSQAILLRNGASLALAANGTNPAAHGIAVAADGAVYVAGNVGIPGSSEAVRWRAKKP